MKIAEALILRADIQKRIAQLKVRLNNNAKIQENEEPSEDPKLLLNELDKLIEELNILIVKINKTNSLSKVDGVYIVDLIAKKDTLSLKTNILREFLNNASSKVDVYSAKEIKIYSSVSVAKLQKEIDKLSKIIRETDTTLQKANWTIDLIEN